MEKEEIKCISLRGSIVYDDGFLDILPIEIDDYLKGTISIKENAPYGKNIDFQIVVFDEDISESVVVGNIYGRLFDMQQMTIDNVNPIEILDGIDQYTWEMYESTNLENSNGVYENIYMIDNIIIENKYRNLKIGSCAIIMLEDMIKEQFNKQVGKFIINPEIIYSKDEKGPLESEVSKLKERCINFWKKLGFQKGEYDDYMYFNMDFDMRKIYEIGGNVTLDYGNNEILAFSKAKSIYRFFNNKKINGFKLKFENITKEELFMLWDREDKSDKEIAELFKTTIPKITYMREKYGITKENLENYSNRPEIIEIIRNCIRLYN